MAQGFTRNLTGTYLVTGSTYLITASYTSFCVTASYIQNVGRVVGLCTAYTPSSTGADASEIPMPYHERDGTSPVSWSIKRFNFRVQTSGSSTSSVTFQKSTGTGIFSATSLETLPLAANTYESTTGSLGTLVSGDKMRFYVNTIGTATNWTLTAEITSTL